jgi:hypothetical protein
VSGIIIDRESTGRAACVKEGAFDKRKVILACSKTDFYRKAHGTAAV